MLAVPVVLAALLASLVPAVGVTAVDPPTEAVRLHRLATNGTGCPPADTDIEMLADNSAFTVRYRNYQASVGGASSVLAYRRNCQLSLQLTAPRGFTFAVSGAEYAGSAHVADGATARMRAQFYREGDSVEGVDQHTLTGPFDGGWTFAVQLESNLLIFFPCGRIRYLNINTELRVGAGRSDPASVSTISFAAPEGVPSTTYHLTWAACPQ